ncbi:MAG: hypothetical protein FGM27_08635 [Candidatus Omnitrophica bacterium]|nr:hypothetical protein [Candidatus Omnitrophota bacterium]
MIAKLRDRVAKFTARERLLFYGASAAVVFVMTDLIVLRPIFSNLELLDAEIKAKSQAIQRDLRILSFKDGIRREYQKYESYLDTGEKTQEEIISSLLRKLESVAKAHDIQIVNVSPGEIEDKPIYKLYKTTLDFEGDLKKVFTFMNDLEESENLFEITRYVLAPKSKTGTVMKCSMDMTRILMTAEDMSAFASEGELEDSGSSQEGGTLESAPGPPPPAEDETAMPEAEPL